MLFPESEEDVEDGAAGSFVGLKKHDVDLWGALFPLSLRFFAHIWLWFVQTLETRGFWRLLRTPANRIRI